MARRVLALLLLHLLFISVTHCKQQVRQKVMQKVDITQVMQKVIISSSSSTSSSSASHTANSR